MITLPLHIQLCGRRGDIDKPLLNYEVELPPQLIAKTKSYIQETQSILEKKAPLSGLNEGDTVEHSILGRGTIISIDQGAGTYTIKFEKITTPRKMSFKAPIKSV